MDKMILRQYERLKNEIANTRKDADRAERQLSKLEKQMEEGTVKDVVKGGEGGWQTFHIEGIPHDLPIKTARRILENRQDLLKVQLEEFAIMVQEVEAFISTVEDSEMRQIIKHRFIDCATWENVAARMGWQYTEDAVKKAFERYMKDK